MTYCSNCGFTLSLGGEKFCPSCGQNLGRQGGGGRVDNAAANNKSISITDTKGEVIGVGFTGSGNIVGKNILVGSGKISVSQQDLAKIPVSEYAQALRGFSESVNQQLQWQANTRGEGKWDKQQLERTGKGS